MYSSVSNVWKNLKTKNNYREIFFDDDDHDGDNDDDIDDDMIVIDCKCEVEENRKFHLKLLICWWLNSLKKFFYCIFFKARQEVILT